MLLPEKISRLDQRVPNDSKWLWSVDVSILMQPTQFNMSVSQCLQFSTFALTHFLKPFTHIISFFQAVNTKPRHKVKLLFIKPLTLVNNRIEIVSTVLSGHTQIPQQ